MLEFISGAGATLVTSGLFVWMFKEALSKGLSRTVQKNVEAFKHELDSTKERLKYELQKDMLRAQLQTNKVHDVYSELYEKLRTTEGAVSRLIGLRLKLDWSGCNQDDFKEALRSMNAPGLKSQALLNRITLDRDAGIKEFEEYWRELELSQASKLFFETKNFLILKALHCSVEVRDLAHEILSCLNSAKVDISLMPDLRNGYETATKSLEIAGTHFEKLEAKMRSELGPSI